jgi:hypothetical protein
MIDPIEEQKRQDRLEAAYFADGRDSLDHPLHSLYTGLFSPKSVDSEVPTE